MCPGLIQIAMSLGSRCLLWLQTARSLRGCKNLTTPWVPRTWGLQALVRACSVLPRGSHSHAFPPGSVPAGSGPPEGHPWPNVTPLPHHKLPRLGALVLTASPPCSALRATWVPWGRVGFVERGGLGHALPKLLNACPFMRVARA